MYANWVYASLESPVKTRPGYDNLQRFCIYSWVCRFIWVQKRLNTIIWKEECVRG